MAPPSVAPFAALLLVLTLVAGCTSAPLPAPAEGYQALGFDGTRWPSLAGQKVTVLAYDAFGYAFGEAKAAFENRTGATVELVTEPDSGRVLERAVREKGDPTFDVVYGVDNVLLGRALREGVFEPYEPLLGPRIRQDLRFLPGGAATPVNHGYIAVNVDPRANLSIGTLDDVRAHAGRFVTQDPRTSTPGLGFLLATVAAYGETGPQDWRAYWRDLFARGLTVTPDWTTAYAQRFSGGYGQFEPGAPADKPLVTSYTTSPAYEMFYGYGTLNGLVLAPKATFHQVQLMGIAKGTPNLAAAQAWIEFALTDEFQRLAASHEAVYPAVDGVDVREVFQGRDPAPGSFEDAGWTYQDLDLRAEGWVRAWTDLYERARS